uniref:(northern house mosquito) hypothetical protein n=1 Tax=Culex pipiens TaxID=7175 RepID=A0A8D8AAW2_CULPI
MFRPLARVLVFAGDAALTKNESILLVDVPRPPRLPLPRPVVLELAAALDPLPPRLPRPPRVVVGAGGAAIELDVELLRDFGLRPKSSSSSSKEPRGGFGSPRF